MIDTKLLRQKILDLAIRGKLVPQDPNDEPACELLKKIKAEKEALIKAGKLKRDKHESFIFQGDDKRYYEQIDGKTNDISGEIPFDLPEGWKWCRLCSLGIFSGGKTPSMNNKAFWNGDILWVTSKDMKTKYITESGLKVSAKGAAELQVLSPGALLIVVRSGILRHTLPVAINRKPCTINQDLKAISLYLPVMQEFIYDVIVALEERILANYKKTGTTVESIIWDKFTQIMLPIPPLAEQKRIVAQIESLLKCVDEIDKESETLEKSLALAKQKILDLAIRGKLVPQDPDDEPASELLKKTKAEKEALVKAGKLKRDKHESIIFRGDDNCYHENIDGKVFDITEEIPFDLPQGWVWCRLNDIMYPIRTKDKQIKSGNILPFGTFPVISQGHENIDGYCDLKDKTITDLPVILFGDHTKNVKYIDFQFIVGADGTKIFRPLCDSKWLFYWTSRAATVINDRGYGRHWNLLLSQIIPLPPLAEQKRIVSQVEKLFSVLETMRV